MRVEGFRQVSLENAKKCLEEGYKIDSAVTRNGDHFLTRHFTTSEKIKLFLLVLIKSVFTYGILPIFSKKLQDEWKAVFSGKISVIPDQQFFSTEYGKTALKTHQQKEKINGEKKLEQGGEANKTHDDNRNKQIKNEEVNKSKVKETENNEKIETKKNAKDPLKKKKHLLFAEKRKEGKLSAGDQKLLNNFLNSSVFLWIEALKKNEVVQITNENTTQLSSEEKEMLKQNIAQRISFLDHHFNFSEKFQKFRPPLKMQELELPIKDTIAYVGLLEEKEFAHFTAEDLKSLNKEQIFYLRTKRIKFDQLYLPTRSRDVDLANGKIPGGENLSKLTLGGLLSLNIFELRFILGCLDPTFIYLIPSSTMGDILNGLDFSTLHLETPEGAERFKAMFPIDSEMSSDESFEVRKLINTLSPKQLSHCWTMLPEKYIREVYLKGVNVRQKEFQERFEEIFPGGTYYSDNSKISDLTFEQIEALWSHFNGYHTSSFTIEQIKSLDFKKFNPENPKDIERFKGLVLKQKSNSKSALEILLRIREILNIILIKENLENLDPKFRKIILDDPEICNNLEEPEKIALNEGVYS